MRYFKVEELITDNGAFLVIKTKRDLVLEDGTSETTLFASAKKEPKLGDAVTCGNRLVRIADRRRDQNGALWLMDEDTRTWSKWDDEN